jgi:hypothetical protein
MSGVSLVGRRNHKILRVCVIALLVVVLLTVASASPGAQQPATGLNIAPVYEGWEQNADGSFDLIFGYFNRNWNEWIDAPVGVANSIEPGGPDQGQPTHFLPRRNQFVFRIRVPRDFGNRELVWTLTTNGKTEKAYGTLKPDYVVNATVMAANFGAGGQTGTMPDLAGNVAPVLKVEGERTRRVKVGEPVSLIAVATDDGKPRIRQMQAFGGRTVPNSATGLRLVWFKYRGIGDVTFDPPQFSAWEDTRNGANSPWAPGWRTPPIPTGNKWEARATFKAPGEYVLRCVAHDGAITAIESVTVVVTP